MKAAVFTPHNTRVTATPSVLLGHKNAAETGNLNGFRDQADLGLAGKHVCFFSRSQIAVL
ncbi:MAG: hypothetical protein ABJM90_02700 [Paracoccaceae bacterium]